VAVLVAVLSLVLGACSSAGTPTRVTRSDATSCPAVTLTRSGERHTGIDEANDRGTWDLTGAVWDENAPDPIQYPIRSDAWTQGCVIGGTVNGDIPRSWTRDQWYDGEDGGTSFGGEAFRQTMTDTPDNFVVIKDAYVDDSEDAYDPNSPDPSNTTYLVHVRTGLVRDDCIENEDVPHNMVVRDSLFDGCFTAFAERPGGEHAVRNGQGDFAFTVESSLVHVRPQRLGPGYCGAEQVAEGRCTPTHDPHVWLGTYGIWKWSPEAASKVTVRDTIFRLDMPSYSSCASQEWPTGTYENVTVVWTGHGGYRNAGDCHNRLPRGVRLTTDLSVWRAAKRAWLDR
jgi:hypothetical protein